MHERLVLIRCYSPIPIEEEKAIVKLEGVPSGTKIHVIANTDRDCYQYMMPKAD